MLGSSNSIACANIMLNTAVAESLRLFADELEGAADLSAALHDLIQRTIREHKRIIFNGNGYDDAWIEEATKNRGLLNLRTTPDAIPMLIQKDNLDMLVRHKVYTESELRSRYEIQLENYCKTVRIEALAMVDISRKEILPAVESYVSGLASAVGAKKAIDAELPWGYEKKQLRRLASLVDAIDDRVDALEEKLIRLDTLSGSMEEAAFIRDELLPGMGALRAAADEAETQTAASYWPFPTYGDLLFGGQINTLSIIPLELFTSQGIRAGTLPGCLSVSKSLAEFAARRRQRNKIIFSRDMCVRENTSQAASVEFVRLRRTNYARSRLQSFVGKTRRVFRQSQASGQEHCPDAFCLHARRSDAGVDFFPNYGGKSRGFFCRFVYNGVERKK